LDRGALRLLKRMLGRKERGLNREHEHQKRLWKTEIDRKCDLCGKPIRLKRFYRCDCGWEDYEIEIPNDYLTILCWKKFNVERPEDHNLYLCTKCYERFFDKVWEIKSRITSNMKIYKFTSASETRNVIFHYVESLIEWLRTYMEYVSEPRDDYLEVKPMEHIWGILFYAKPKNPLEPIYKVLIPYETVFTLLRG